MCLIERICLHTYMQFSESVLHVKFPVINHCREMCARLAQYIPPFFCKTDRMLFIKYILADNSRGQSFIFHHRPLICTRAKSQLFKPQIVAYRNFADKRGIHSNIGIHSKVYI